MLSFDLGSDQNQNSIPFGNGQEMTVGLSGNGTAVSTLEIMEICFCLCQDWLSQQCTACLESAKAVSFFTGQISIPEKCWGLLHLFGRLRGPLATLPRAGSCGSGFIQLLNGYNPWEYFPITLLLHPSLLLEINAREIQIVQRFGWKLGIWI